MRQALVVVDYQKDFVDGSLGFSQAAALEDAICAKIEAYHAKNQAVIFTLDTHDDNYLKTQEGRKLPIARSTLPDGSFMGVWPPYAGRRTPRLKSRALVPLRSQSTYVVQILIRLSL